jgi:protein gp37
MGAKTKIEWTDATWSPIKSRLRSDAREICGSKGYSSLLPIVDKLQSRIAEGKHMGVGHHCEHVSSECSNCYAETNGRRMLPANGLGLPYDRRSRDLLQFYVDPKLVDQPAHCKEPRRWFVENQSDLFAGWIPDDLIDVVFAAMAQAPYQTFQVLTKRPQRMREYITGDAHLRMTRVFRNFRDYAEPVGPWPLPNVWLGVSAGDQKAADERISVLLETPAAVRFVSYEPALGPLIIDNRHMVSDEEFWNFLTGERGSTAQHVAARPQKTAKLDWVIAGGESGHGARTCDVQWIRSVVKQCKAARVACFVKQLGALPGMSMDEQAAWGLKVTGKGENPEEWPEDLRVREFPGTAL